MDIEEVQKVAALARLALSEEELSIYGQQLNQILGYIDVLDEVDIEDVEPMPHAVEMQNIFRDDERRPSLDQSAALANAPQTDGQFFQVPPVFERTDT